MLMQPVYIEDVARAIMAALSLDTVRLAKSPKGKVYELGGPDIYSFQQLMEMTLKHIPTSPISVPVPFLPCHAVHRLRLRATRLLL